MEATTEVKLCINCVHLLGKRMNTEQAGAWRCHHPSNILSDTTDLVTGAQVLTYVAPNLYDCRSSLGICGIAGVNFKRYMPPASYEYAAAIPQPSSDTAARLAALKAKQAKPKLEDLI